ncbi:MAG: helix-turn-helix transcriptional regulator [Eubacteriales bacterium]|nr:helix-turn-helix transcriptional regulator [Eubacteriales bacterium]
MKLEDAVILRIEQLCIERNMTKYNLFLKSGVPQSTLTSIKKKRSGSVKISTLYAICEGFDISLEEFFHSPLFSQEELAD